MKIPFALHRKIPPVRRVLERLDRTTAERDALRAQIIEMGIRPKGPIDPLIFSRPDASLTSTMQEIWSLLRPMDVAGGVLVRKGRPNDGGYVMLDSGLENAIAYSLGINDDVSWDFDMVRLGCQIFQYDHTIDGLPKQHKNFHWHKTGIAACRSDDGVMQSLTDIIAANGHDREKNLLLKMDIEGHEWDVFESTDIDVLQQFSQITMEMHTLALGEPDFLRRVKSILAKVNSVFQPIHVHANNNGYLGIVGGVTIPDTMEVTYVRRANHEFRECTNTFPRPLDMPCRKDAPDFFLGALGALPAPNLR